VRLVIRSLSWFFRKLPLSWAMLIGRLLGWLWFYVLPIRRGVALDNVRRALGDQLAPAERRRIVRRCFEHQTMMAVESLRMLDLTRERAADLLERVNFEPYWRAYERGQGVLVFMGHIGNYEMLAACAGMLGEPVNAVVRDFKNRAVNDFVADVRRRTRYKTIPPRRSKEQIKATLAQNEAVVLLVDQHMPRHRAIVCSFFGQLAATSPAPVRFAMETGAPLFPLVVMRDLKRPGHHIARFEPQFDIETPYDNFEDNLWHNSERINRVLEGWIRTRPEEWLWMHKRWKAHDNPEGWDVRPELSHLRERGAQ
jgi:KDO2-lipid IV(A) lauroyltransferase